MPRLRLFQLGKNLGVDFDVRFDVLNDCCPSDVADVFSDNPCETPDAPQFW